MLVGVDTKMVALVLNKSLVTQWVLQHAGQAVLEHCISHCLEATQ